MLLLSRRVGQVIRIGDNIVVRVLAVKQTAAGVQVRLGIEAPREIPVHRREIQMMIDAAKESDACDH